MGKRKTFMDCLNEEIQKHPERYTPEKIARRKQNWETMKWVLAIGFVILMIISLIYSESDSGKRAMENMDRQNYYDRRDRERAEILDKIHQEIQHRKWDMERR